MKNISLLISSPKSLVLLLSPDTHYAKTHPRILTEDLHLPLVQCSRILGVYMYTSLSFNKHSGYVAERVSSGYPQGLGSYILGITEGNITDDIQGSGEIDNQLCCTCLDIDTVRLMEQTNGLHPGFHLSGGGKPILRRTKT